MVDRDRRNLANLDKIIDNNDIHKLIDVCSLRQLSGSSFRANGEFVISNYTQSESTNFRLDLTETCILSQQKG